ncbi:MAG: hypothetical protein ABH983_05840 [Candidatus Micrarchaeota archaeon]|nr:hypothetical protein [Candidatus Micrarchaeota archaeon]MBU1681804.1 hypothetical protein [Candidatus Micrarchaeota archaeon]
MQIFPKKFDKKEWLVFIVAIVIYTIIFAIVEYGYGFTFASGLLNIIIKSAIFLFVIYPVVRGIYLRLNLARFLK